MAGMQELLTVHTDGFRAYNPLEENNAFDREYIVYTMMENTPMETDTPVPVRATDRWRDSNSCSIETSPETS